MKAVGSWQSAVGSCVMRFFLFFIFFFFTQKNFAQHTVPMNEDAAPLDYYLNAASAHSSIKPYLDADVRRSFFCSVDSEKTSQSGDLVESHTYQTCSDFGSPRSLFKNYYRKSSDSSAYSSGKNFASLIRPIYDGEIGYDAVAKRTLSSTVGGIILDADYKQKIGIEVRLAAGKVVLPNYLDSVAHFSGTMPGWGDRAYPLGNAAYAFQHLSGNIIWRPSKVFNFQIGRDKHFWGDGYRSLFLSDLGAAFPYAQMQTTIWHLQYTSMFAWMQDWTNSLGAKKDFRNKFGTFHYISWNATKWLNIGVFEAIIWQGSDNVRFRGFDANYLDPMVFYRPIEFSLGSPDNAMLGFAGKIRFNRNNVMYGQIILDEFLLKNVLARNGWWANKQGLQAGYKCFNFGMTDNLFLQIEVNIVRPYTYTHGSPQQNYSNGGMPLAHPLGANFADITGILSYRIKTWFDISGKMIIAHYGLDMNGKDYGQNIYISYLDHFQEYNNWMFQGLSTYKVYAELKTGFRLNTKFPLRFEITGGARFERTSKWHHGAAYMMAGLSLPLWRKYWDY